MDPEMSARAETSRERQLRLIPFGPPRPARTIGLAWRPSSCREPEFELFAEAIRSGLGR